MVTSARRCAQLVFTVGFILALLHSTEAVCSSHEMECGKGGQCVNKDHLCNQRRDCSDGSDEDSKMCELWPARSSNCRYDSTNTIYYSGGCRTAYYMCQSTSRSRNLPNTKICEIMRKTKLESQQEGMNMTSEVVNMLSSAVNSTLDYKVPDCPMLYTRVGNDCLSFFSPAKVSWAEARQFCVSIYGDLWHIKDYSSYGNLMEHLREEEFTSNYWIGGRYDLDTNAWSWRSDDSAMPLGAPFWVMRHEDSCVARGPPHTNPYSTPPAALPGAPCFSTVMSPKKRVAGWCSAMTYEYFYYWSDETCDETFSPLCIFTGPAAARQSDAQD